MNPVESFTVDRDEVFLDGPVSSRLAVLDFNPTTNRLRKGARFRAAERHRAGQVRDRRRDRRRVAGLHAGERLRDGAADDEDVRRPGTRWAASSPGRSTCRSFWSCRELANGRTRSTNANRAACSSSPFLPAPTNRRRPFTPVPVERHRRPRDGPRHSRRHRPRPLPCVLTPQSLALHEGIADLPSRSSWPFERDLAKPSSNRIPEERGTVATVLEDSNDFAGIAEGYQPSASAPFADKHFLRNLNNDRSLDPKLKPGDAGWVAPRPRRTS